LLNPLVEDVLAMFLLKPLQQMEEIISAD